MDKITSEEQLRKLIGNTRYTEIAQQLANQLSDLFRNGRTSAVEADQAMGVRALTKGDQHATLRDSVAWWTVREEWRFQRSLYTSTLLTATINRLGLYFAHTSTEDKTMVAYTPDAQSGEADRQVRLAPGRLLAKVAPFLAEEYRTWLVNQHIAEVSDEVHFLDGEDIVKWYISTTASGDEQTSSGLASCMTGKTDYKESEYPALVYNTPGVRLAVVKAGDKISGRCLVYENPNDPEDKRYIRGYGAPFLVTRLKNRGYKAGGWIGVKFNTVKSSRGRSSVPEASQPYSAVVVPYLDANGGMCSPNGSTVAIVDGVLTGVVDLSGASNPRTANWLERGSHFVVPSTAGYTTLHHLNSEDFAVEFNGKTYNKLFTKFRTVSYIDLYTGLRVNKEYPQAEAEQHAELTANIGVRKVRGVLAPLLNDEMLIAKFESWYAEIDKRDLSYQQWLRIWCINETTQETVTLLAKQLEECPSWDADQQAFRLSANLIRVHYPLDKDLYPVPDDTDADDLPYGEKVIFGARWFSRAIEVVHNSKRVFIKTADATKLAVWNTEKDKWEMQEVHLSTIDSTKLTYKKIGSNKVWIDKRTKHRVRTRSGSWAYPGLQDIVQYADGTYDFVRNSRTASLQDWTEFTYPRKGTVEEIENLLTTWVDNKLKLVQQSLQPWHLSADFVLRDNSLMYNGRSMRFDDLDTAQKWLDNAANMLKTMEASSAAQPLTITNGSVNIYRLRRKASYMVVKQLSRTVAEMLAEESPAHLGAFVAPVTETFEFNQELAIAA
jgi:hypothetical protein